MFFTQTFKSRKYMMGILIVVFNKKAALQDEFRAIQWSL
jgi:hypothetical protein